MNRKIVLAANWKMQLNREESVELAKGISNKCGKIEDREIILFPSFLHIPLIADIIKDTKIGLGGQNLYFEDKGAYTGEIAAFQLKEAGCTHVMIGHSERRHYFSEDYETVNKKIKRAIAEDLKIMLCVGESLQERENGVTEMVVVDQLESAFLHVAAKHLKNIYVAYEPIWAIGTGKTPKPDDAAHVHKIIRKNLNRQFSAEVADAMPILYGGSVNADNIDDFLAENDVDGALIGGASLSIESFLGCLKILANK